MRQAKLQRSTTETDIVCSLKLEGTGSGKIDTGCGFLNHMLELFCRHGRFDIKLACKGDTQVDDHHTVEDCGLVLGRAFSQALGDRKGICRYGSMLLPMDEALVLVALDICGRPTLDCRLEITAGKIGSFDTELLEEFFLAFTRELGLSLHIRQLAGANGHHIAEAAFKGLGRALAQAVAINAAAPDAIPSTKGTIL